jgi:hypothetical protein
MLKKQLISITYRAVRNVKANILKFLCDFNTVIITQLKYIDKLQERKKFYFIILKRIISAVSFQVQKEY